MNAKELRLGNIVKIDNPKYHPNVTQPLRVAGITETSLPNPSETEYCIQLNSLKENENIVTPLYSQLSEFVKPIPITEEILKKCGIKYLGYRAENDCKVFGNKNTDFTLLRGSKRSLLPGQSLFYMIHGEWLGCDIEHLHQLQNLYFSITNKELEVKL